MSGENTQATLVGNFRERYAPNVKFLYQQAAPMVKLIGFEKGVAIGNKYHQPVDLALEHGFSAAAPGVLPTGATYIPPTPGQSGDAQVDAFQIHGRASVTYSAIARSQAEAAAYLDSVKFVIKRLTLGAAKRAEWTILNGQEGWGNVNGTNPGSAASRIVTISDATWASGSFIGAKNMPLDLYSDNSGVPSSSRISTGRSFTQDPITITSVNYQTKTVTLACPNATDQSLAIGTAWLFPESHSILTEMPGLGKITSNAAVLFNIDASLNDLWAGNQLAIGATLSFAKVLEAHGLMAPFFPQAMNNETLSLVPPKGYEVLNGDQAALREFNVDKTTAENGFEGLRFRSQVGMNTIQAHAMVRDSRFHICVAKELKRIGSQDTEFIQRGKSNGEELILESATSPASEMRTLLELALFSEAPRHTFLGTSLTY